MTSKITIREQLSSLDHRVRNGATRYRDQITVDDGNLEQFGTVQSVPSPDGL